MEIIDCTPPADLPRQLIVMNSVMAKANPVKGFYLRLANDENHDVAIVDLDNVVTPVGARKLAIEKGYSPKHWMNAHDGMICPFF